MLSLLNHSRCRYANSVQRLSCHVLQKQSVTHDVSCIRPIKRQYHKHFLSFHVQNNRTICRFLHSDKTVVPTLSSEQQDITVASSAPSSSTSSSLTTIKSIEDRLYDIIHGINGAKFRLFIRAQIKELSEDPSALAMAKSKYIEEKLWGLHCFNFRRKLAKTPENIFQGKQLTEFLTLLDQILDSDNQFINERTRQKSLEQFRSLLLTQMLSLAETELREEITSSLTLLSCSDLRLPHEWYAPARIMKRKIIFHGGPTNSGMFA